MMIRTSRILCAIVIGSFLLAAPASGAAKRVGIDKRFGSGGWVKIPDAPNRRWSNTELTCSAGQGGQALVAARYDTGRDNSKPKAGLLISLNSRGQRVRSFGKNGLLRFGRNEIPTYIGRATRNKWLVTFSNQARTSWKVVRLTRRGIRDKSFSGDGVLEVPGTAFGPSYNTLEGGGFVTYSSGVATVFDPSGEPRQSINGTGALSAPFAITSVFETSERKLLVSGRLDNQILATLLEADGRQSAGWNGGLPLTIGPPPESSWKPELQKLSNPPKDFTAQHPWISSLRNVGGAVELGYTFEAVNKSEGADQYVSMRIRLLATGAFDTQLGASGWDFEGAEYVDDSLEAGDSEAINESFHLPDGREVSAQFIYGSEQDPGSWATFRISDKRGGWSTRSARRVTVNKLRFDGYDFDDAGKNMIVCGERNFSTDVVGRVKL